MACVRTSAAEAFTRVYVLLPLRRSSMQLQERLMFHQCGIYLYAINLIVIQLHRELYVTTAL